MTSSPHRRPSPPDLHQVQQALHALFIGVQGTSLRKEDLKKAEETTALLQELARVGKDPRLVDAAAGRAYVGLLAAHLLGFGRVTLIEREPRRVALCRVAAAGLPGVTVTEGDVSDPAAWPSQVDVVVALHACGPASDAVIDAALRLRPRWLLLVPCCTSEAVESAARARRKADGLGIPRQAEVRRRFIQSWVDAERTLRLEAGGYEVTVVPFVPPTTTPHNLLWRCRWRGPGSRSEEARLQLERLLWAPGEEERPGG